MNCAKILVGVDCTGFMMSGPAYVGCSSDSLMLTVSGVLADLSDKGQKRELVGDKGFLISRIVVELGCTMTHAPLRSRGLIRQRITVFFLKSHQLPLPSGAKSLGVVHGLATVAVAAARALNERAVSRITAFDVVTKGESQTELSIEQY
jgi:hypothetical protein